MRIVRVLLIDDHNAFRINARRALEAAGYEVVGMAGDGQSGLRAARDLQPDVVLLDIGLPDVSGLDLAQVLHDEAPALPVVLISTHDAGDLAELARTHGARGFLTKDELFGDALARVIAVG
jgi:DNA-binding NarL/FixJ family response regulator